MVAPCFSNGHLKAVVAESEERQRLVGRGRSRKEQRKPTLPYSAMQYGTLLSNVFI